MGLSELFSDARATRCAVGHFNVANLEMLRAVAAAAKDAGARRYDKPEKGLSGEPRAERAGEGTAEDQRDDAGASGVMIGTSEGERDHIGLAQVVALADAFQKEYAVPLFLNADHSKSVGSCKAAIDAGYTSIHFDGSALSYEENVAKTQKVVVYSKEKLLEVEPPTMYSAVKGVSVEGELGYLGGGSTITQKKVRITSDQMTDPGQAREYVERTGVDRLAVAIGNVHGLNLEEPALDFERLQAIREAVPERCALVLHAGSGISDEDIRKAIELGIVNIHVSTELRKAWRDALTTALKERPDEYAPHKILEPAIQAVRAVAAKKIRLFCPGMER